MHFDFQFPLTASVSLRTLGTVCAALVGMVQAAPTVAQTTDAQIQQLQDEKQRAELQADIAKANALKAQSEADAFKAQLGSLSTANLPKGAISTDNVVIEADYLAYMAAGKAATAIAQQVGCHGAVLFFSGKDLDAIQALATLKAQMALLQSPSDPLFDPLHLQAVALPVLVMPSPLGSNGKPLYDFLSSTASSTTTRFAPALALIGMDTILSIASLFKTDIEMKGVSVTSDDAAFQAMIAKQLLLSCPGIKVIHPAYFSAPLNPNDPLLDRIHDLADLSSKAEIRMHELESYVQTPLMNAVDSLKKLAKSIDDLDQRKTELEALLNAASPAEKPVIQMTLDDVKKQLNSQQAELAKLFAATKAHDANTLLGIYLSDLNTVQAATASLKGLIARISDLNTAITKVDPSGGTLLQTLLKAEAMDALWGEGGVVLQAKIAVMGGNSINKKNVFTSELQFTGGAIAHFYVMSRGGQVTNSGVVACYGGNVSEKELSTTLDGSKGDNPALPCRLLP